MKAYLSAISVARSVKCFLKAHQQILLFVPENFSIIRDSFSSTFLIQPRCMSCYLLSHSYCMLLYFHSLPYLILVISSLNSRQRSSRSASLLLSSFTYASPSIITVGRIKNENFDRVLWLIKSSQPLYTYCLPIHDSSIPIIP